jgi:hypothetical protein
MIKTKLSIITFIKICLIVIIIGLGFFLRLNNHRIIPQPGESIDEYANAWSGLGLIQIGVPVGWSFIENDIYQPFHRYINVDNVYQVGTAHANPFYLHSPWLDHPPGMGILIGGFAYIKGARVLEDTGTFLIRKPMVALGTLNILLIYIIGYLYFNFKTGFLSSLIYAVSPLIVVANRLPQAENGFVPLFLISIILIKLFINKKNYLYLFLAALVSGIGVWFKIPALMISVSGFFLILFSSSDNLKNRLKSAITFGFIGVTFGLIPILAYGLALDPQAFFQVLAFHSQRFYGIGLSALYQLFTQSKITKEISLTDGWLIFGWFSWLILLYTLKDKQKKSLIAIPLFICLIFFIFLGSEFYGWYVYPFFPWLALSIGVLFNSVKQQSKLLAPISLLVTLPSQILLTKLNVINDYPHFVGYWRYGLAIYLFFTFLTYFTSHHILIKIQKILIYLWFILAIYLSIKYVYSLDPGTWLTVN